MGPSVHATGGVHLVARTSMSNNEMLRKGCSVGLFSAFTMEQAQTEAVAAAMVAAVAVLLAPAASMECSLPRQHRARAGRS